MKNRTASEAWAIGSIPRLAALMLAMACLPVLAGCQGFFDDPVPKHPDWTKLIQQDDRGQQYNELVRQYATVQGSVSERYEDLINDGMTDRRLTLGIGVGGMLSGVAAAALVAASPANAACVAILSGLSGGVAGFQTGLIEQGFSGQAVVAQADRWRTELKSASDAVDKALAAVRDQVNAKTSADQWNAAVTNAVSAINGFDMANALRSPRNGTADDKVIQDMRKLLDERDQKLLEAINKKSPTTKDAKDGPAHQ